MVETLGRPAAPGHQGPPGQPAVESTTLRASGHRDADFSAVVLGCLLVAQVGQALWAIPAWVAEEHLQ